MSLDYNASKCAQRVTPEAHSGEIYTLSVAMMATDTQQISTDKEIREFLTRIWMWEAVHGPLSRIDGEPVKFPAELAFKWRHLSVNVAPQSRSRFIKPLWDKLEHDAQRAFLAIA